MYQGLTQYYLYNMIGIGIFLVFVVGGYYTYKRYQTKKHQRTNKLYISDKQYLERDQQYEKQQLIEKIQQEYEQLKKNIVQKGAPINEDMEKFLVVYQQKDKDLYNKSRTIEEKNRTIYLLQNQVQLVQHKLEQQTKQNINYQEQEETIIQQKEYIQQLKKRCEELENKFKKVALLHKSITEKEELHQQIIDEKNAYIIALQKKLQTSEDQFTKYKENDLDERFLHLQKQIESSKDKQRIIIILTIVCIGLSIYGYRYVQKQSTLIDTPSPTQEIENYTK